MLDIKLEPTRARPDLPISALLKHDSVEVIPNPAQGAALRQLGMLRTDDAALAGLSGSEGWMIDQLWPEVLADLGVHVASGEQAAWDLATSFQLAAWRAGERSTTYVMSQVIRAYIETDYPRYAPEAGHLYGLDDELAGEWGRAHDDVLAEAEQTLTEWAERRGISL